VILEAAPAAVEKKPAAHSVHVVLEAAPTAAEYVPATHSMQSTEGEREVSLFG
jgi:hypothetical protein